MRLRTATRKPRGNGLDPALVVLKDIRDEIKGTNVRLGALEKEFVGLRKEFGGLRSEVGGLRSEVGGLRSEVRELRHDVDALETATIRGFEGVAARLDNILEFTGERWRDHEDRLRRLETRRAGNKPGT